MNYHNTLDIHRMRCFCRTTVLGLGLGVDFVFAKNGQSLRNRMAEPPQPMAEPPQPEPSPKIYQNEVYYRLGIWYIDLTHKTNTR